MTGRRSSFSRRARSREPGTTSRRTCRSRRRRSSIRGPASDAYRLYRPSPLFRAHRLEKVLDTPAHIYYKYEGGSPAGSHKPNTAIPQAYYNAAEGTKRLTTETGAGQWGSARAFACAQYGID